MTTLLKGFQRKRSAIDRNKKMLYNVCFLTTFGKTNPKKVLLERKVKVGDAIFLNKQFYSTVSIEVEKNCPHVLLLKKIPTEEATMSSVLSGKHIPLFAVSASFTK